VTAPVVPLNRRNVLSAALGVASAAIAGIGISAPKEISQATEALVPFRIAVPQEHLDDLRIRLSKVRWPDAGPAKDWSQGVPLAAAQALIDHWRRRYDWRRLEAQANAHPQFRTQIDGLGFHFFHVRSPHPEALALVLTHGWPGSFVEFLAVIDPLTHPTRHGGRAQDAFHVVIPSLPGFGFSDKPMEKGWDAARTARAWAVLMKRLGYDRWVAQGGDWGSRVVHALAKSRPPGLVAVHTNWPFVFPENKPASPTPPESQAYADLQNFMDKETGYAKEQQTRPQTLGYALADSPTGQAMWIYEKFQAWTDNAGTPEGALSIDSMLDDITLYWLTDSGASSARFYLENTKPGPASYSAGRIELPMAASIFPKEIYRPPRAWAETLWPNLLYWNELDRGGHFAAFEQPALFVEELRRSFSTIRSSTQ
jgi:epoxide hydrolase